LRFLSSFSSRIEDDLQQAEADHDQGETDVVHLNAFALAAAQPRWIFHDDGGEEEGEQADGNVDKEDPTPVVVVGDPAAERRADGRGHDHGHAENGEGLTTLFGREGIGQDGLLAGAHAASASALQDTEEDEHGQCGRESTQARRDGEHHDAGHVETFASNDRSEPARHGQHNGVRDQVTGEDPGGFVGAGAEASRDVPQGNVGDGGVQNLHERGQRHREGDDPWVEAGLPGSYFVMVGIGHGVALSARENKIQVLRLRALRALR
jgi:hypothetical protein